MYYNHVYTMGSMVQSVKFSNQSFVIIIIMKCYYLLLV